GNSLIGNDFYESHLDLDDATLYKINCFDWEEEFKSIFKGGGFDVVIGNPPYFNIQTLGHNSPIANYITSKYSNIWQDKSDILFYFLYKAIK
ncbi:Eco57I restriction-modification methylase domain-containing protein, partial [Brachyspira pilosicoli]|uniref:Eco57I restriction-modification methylase domain-containing protein n=1 Tax=Brachyspira pilosicoli TaxID=52584 RepID=UPI001CA5C810